MKIVIDTNVVISGVFFGGLPRQILTDVVAGKLIACATTDIVDEYLEITAEMLSRKQGHLSKNLLDPLIHSLLMVPAVSQIAICRDPDDDKFINCAKDAGAVCIISGDNDLLVLRYAEGIRIVTVREFYDMAPELFS